MIRITLAASTQAIASTGQQIFEELQASADVEPLACVLEVVQAATTAEIIALKIDADVVVARGASAIDLQRLNYHIPVVELVINSDDIVSLLHQLKTQYGDVPAAAIGSYNMITGIDRVGTQMGVDIHPYYLHENTEEEIYHAVMQAIEDGKRVILGGARGCVYARNFGLPAILIESGHASIRNALIGARQLGKTSRQNNERNLIRSIMVDHASEGLISFDLQQRITAINASACQLLHIDSAKQCIGVPLTELIHIQQLNRLLTREEPIIQEILEHHGTLLSVRKVAVYMQNQLVGNVLTFVTAAQIHETEGRLRGKQYHKGHAARYSFSDIVYVSQIMRNTVDTALSYAETDSNVMLIGETGTGKELFSQSIHNASSRAGQPFVAVNCAAIAENLLESELFGYVSGAFTGASKEGKAGLFEMAHKGTIFLDEISEMPLSLQGRLLRVLQEREIMRLGHDRVIPVDVRVIAATNRDLLEQVHAGKFREDLYYRLFVLVLLLPPLRMRGQDIVQLAHHFVDTMSMRMRKSPPVFSQQADAFLCAQAWSGNIRQLSNFCERLIVLCQPNELLTDQRLQTIYDYRLSALPEATALPLQSTDALPKTSVTAEQIQQALQQTHGNRTLAATQLGISRVTLWRLCQRWDIS